jgi:disulfide bond formation protein DsbB
MLLKLSPPFSLIAIVLIGLVTIAAAWGFQIFGGYAPCPLCLQQRWPYYAVIPLALVLLSQAGRSPGLLRTGLLLITLIMLAGAALALYHVGIELKWWTGPVTCAAAGGLSGGLPDLAGARIVRCDEAPWRFLGLSFAGWNLVISLLLAAIALGAALRRNAYGSSSVSQ